MYIVLVIYFKYNLEMLGDIGKQISVYVFYNFQCMYLEIYEYDELKVEIEIFFIIKVS